MASTNSYINRGLILVIDKLESIIENHIGIVTFFAIYFVVYFRFIPIFRRVSMFTRFAPQSWYDDSRLRYKILAKTVDLLDSIFVVPLLIFMVSLIAASLYIFVIGTGYGIGVYEEPLLSEYPYPTFTILLYILGLSLTGKFGYDIVQHIDNLLRKDLDSYDLHQKILLSKTLEEE